MTEANLNRASFFCPACRELLVPDLLFCDQCGSSLGSRGENLVSITFGPVVHSQGAIPTKILGTFSEYVLLSEIGAGGMGRVYRAMAPRSGQLFAIKVVSADLKLRGGTAGRFAKEAETQSQIVHPNVVRVHAFREDAGVMGLIMELVDGQSLDLWLGSLPNRQAPVAKAEWLIRQMLAGISVVHYHNYVHADVKPGNFLLGQTDHHEHVLKIADFGIARQLQKALTGPKPKFWAGTPGYMPPEQIRGEHLDARSDLYALGCLLYELLAGRIVFPGTSTDEQVQQHLHAAPQPLGTFRRDVPQHLSRLVSWMLQKDPQKRPASAGHVLQWMDQLENRGR
jgi:serine/threonine protein kinase